MIGRVRKYIEQIVIAVCLITVIWQQVIIWTMQLNDARYDMLGWKLDVIRAKMDDVVILTPCQCQPAVDDDDIVLTEVAQ